MQGNFSPVMSYIHKRIKIGYYKKEETLFLSFRREREGEGNVRGKIVGGGERERERDRGSD